MFFIRRPYQSLFRIPLSFLSGTMMDLALDKPPVKIVKWSYSMIFRTDTYKMLQVTSLPHALQFFFFYFFFFFLP